MPLPQVPLPARCTGSEVLTFGDENVKSMLHGAVEVACKGNQLKVLAYWLGTDSPQPALLYSTDYYIEDDVTGPLTILAAQYGKEKVLQMLLASGLCPDLPNSWGQTPVSVACQEGHLDVVRLLLLHQADIRQPDWNFGMEPIHYAADSGHLHIIKFLHGQGVAMQTVCRYPDPEFDPESPPASHTETVGPDKTSEYVGMLSVVEALSCHSGILTQQTPLMIARHCGHDAVAEFLEDPSAASQSPPLKCETVSNVKERSAEPLSVRADRVGVTARLRCIPSDLSARALNGTDDEKKKAKADIHKIQKGNQQIVSRAEQKAKK